MKQVAWRLGSRKKPCRFCSMRVSENQSRQGILKCRSDSDQTQGCVVYVLRVLSMLERALVNGCR